MALATHRRQGARLRDATSRGMPGPRAPPKGAHCCRRRPIRASLRWRPRSEQRRLRRRQEVYRAGSRAESTRLRAAATLSRGPGAPPARPGPLPMRHSRPEAATRIDQWVRTHAQQTRQWGGWLQRLRRACCPRRPHPLALQSATGPPPARMRPARLRGSATLKAAMSSDSARHQPITGQVSPQSSQESHPCQQE
jgi:hypothetical protein